MPANRELLDPFPGADHGDILAVRSPLEWRGSHGQRLVAHLQSDPGLDLTDVAYSLATTRGSLDHRAVAMGDDSAGLIDALGLAALEDDRQYFPPYDAGPVVHAATLLRHPAIGTAVSRVSGRVSAAEMRRMNSAVDGERQDPADVVRRFLDSLDRGV